MADVGMNVVSDAELVLRAQEGELSAFETLVSRHERRIYALALRMLRNPHDAEDVTQQTFIDALEGLKGFRSEASFATWILRIATYASLKILRKRKGLEVISLDHALDPGNDGVDFPHPEYIADWRESPERLAQHGETGRLIEEALDELDEKYRVIFLLRDVQGLSVRETAEALGLSEVNVKVRLLRARLQLRERLTRSFGDPARRWEPHRHAD